MTKEIIHAITDFIFVEHKPNKADFIFLPGGSHPELGEKATELWKQGYAPKVFVAGGVSVKNGVFHGPRAKSERYNGEYHSECEFLTDVLVKNGVPKNAIMGENKSGHTKQNAQFTKETLDNQKITVNSAIIVCKAFHARRCLMCYALFFPCTKFYIVPFDGFGITRSNWYQSEYGIQRVMGELSRCGQQFTDDYIASIER